MGKKLTEDFVRCQIELSGYRMIGAYKDNRTKIELVCTVGHNANICYSDFQQGKRCRDCAIKKRSDIRRLPEKLVQSQIEDAGYQLASSYKDSKSLLKLICPEGHEYKACWSSFQQGHRCPHCLGLVLIHEQVKEVIEDAGYQILSSYKNSTALMDLVCDKGHSYKARWGSFQQGQRCPHCAGRVVTQERVKALVEADGCRLLSDYKGSKVKIKIDCGKGHEYDTWWGDFRNGHRCPKCFRESLLLRFEDIKVEVEAENYKVDGDWVGSNSLLLFTCDRGHQYETTWSTFRQGCRCPYCAKVAVNKQEVKEYFDSFGYSLKSDYVNSYSPLTIVCDEGHTYAAPWHVFQQGYRCPQCSIHGFNPNKPGLLYYVRFEHQGSFYYKIGITNLTIERRFRCEPTPYIVISETRYLFGFLAQKEERLILAKNRRHSYQGVPFLESGNTELFVKDVLKLDLRSRQRLNLLGNIRK